MALFPLRFIPDNTRIDFIRGRWVAFIFSGIFMVVCAVSIAVQGLNFGIDFTGGVLVEARLENNRDLGQLRSDLNNRVAGEISLTTFGGDDRNLMIRIPLQPGGEEADIAALAQVKELLGSGVDYRRTELVGPKVGGELVRNGIYAVVCAMLAMTVYLWFRFEWQYALGCLLALIHDVLVTVGFFSLLQVQFDLTSIAAVMTVAGYSINDTIVIFDRMREEMRRYKKMPIPEVINLSINRTLSRTVMTSGTTLLALLCLFLFGGDVLRIFSLAIIWGIFVGTYSSIYISAPALLYFRFSRSGEGDTPKAAPDARTGRTRLADGTELEAASGADLAFRAARAEAEFLGNDGASPTREGGRRTGPVVGRPRRKP
ncbi:protein translocase subunit SecF [Phaeovibrio sulfidiphilus]|uniref:Protein-export membrane protein SecF n=1 Tax=Phaeovibrio sulfidiphilus TaxID=1220600 RepID=A0A8J7CC46_9PROT|nr:protein translocase subunit SecF [Phaeovibrio sulfidiphilus]MBE1236888.1 protein translocase subunit SecF [Phaeovibrio sulfidiphilus]